MKNIHLPSLELYTPQEVTIHYKRPYYESMAHIRNSEDSNFYLRKFIDADKIDHKEFFWVLLLNNGNRLLAFSEIGSGSDAGVVINHKEIFQLILRINASSFIVAHNHPSGSLTISKQDKEETQRLEKISKLLSIRFLDHLIITSESFLSFADAGRM